MIAYMLLRTTCIDIDSVLAVKIEKALQHFNTQ